MALRGVEVIPSLLKPRQDCCPKLEVLRLSTTKREQDTAGPLTDASIACCRFFSTATRLRELHISGQAEYWSQSAFTSIVCNPSIEVFYLDCRLNHVKHDWIEQVADPHGFQKLRQLDLSTTPKGLALLLPRLRDIERLLLRIEEGLKTEFLAPLEHLPNLWQFNLHFGGSDAEIKADALLYLAQCCPNLRYVTVTIGDHRECDARTITDSIIDAFTQAQPELKAFSLEVTSTSITEKSILSFGTNCKSLERLSLTGTINFVRLAENGSTNLFPSLRRLLIRRRHPYEPHYLKSKQVFETMATSLASMMPQLEIFDATGPGFKWPENSNYSSICKAVKDLLSRRVKDS